MTDLATLQTQLDRLRAARASGARVVTFTNGENTQHVEYKSDGEMRAAIADLERRVATLAGPPPLRNITVRSKGWFP